MADVSEGGKHLKDGPEPSKQQSATPGMSLATPTVASSKPQYLQLTSKYGDIFSAPPNTVLIHACNTQGSWGGGIALVFRNLYPLAYRTYRNYCLKAHEPKTSPVPTGTCLLIPPCETKPGAPQHWIACLFTSSRYGRKKDSSAVILQNTGPAVKDMLRKLREKKEQGMEVGALRMCLINSGKFGVPWQRTAEVLRGIVVEEGCGGVEIWEEE